MSDVAIRVDNLSKKFYLGERVGIKTFREALQELVTAPFRVWRKNGNGQDQEKVDTDREIWALKGVSFEVKHGEVLGIIGPNGAGKSTLLKILSRITEPTGGYAEIRGRVGSLLEVGTGFHPELTGRENVYLNGAILGMSRAEIRRKFDDIVSFAGVEKFIDTPVKRYSSGMQVRLAFAVAAHLDPEILIIDEVLAVGDAEFQKRCLGKMNEVSRSGRTVLFVSHNMAAVEGLCSRAILVEKGCIVMTGPARSVVDSYLRTATTVRPFVDLSAHPNRPTGSRARVTMLRLSSNNGDEAILRIGSDLYVDISFAQLPRETADTVSFSINNTRGICVATCNSRIQSGLKIPAAGVVTVRCTVREIRLTPGIYTIDISIKRHGRLLDYVPAAGTFEIAPTDTYGTGKLVSDLKGILQPKTEWSICSR